MSRIDEPPCNPKAPTDYSRAIARLGDVIQEEMHEWHIGGIACALVDDGELVFAAGFGEARRESIFRVGSIGKLFNAIAVMQQVEAGRLELDAPLPAELLPLNPFTGATRVTLRQILCHRSGLPREPAVGGYYDDTEPTMAATIASVRSCVLASPPGDRARYSNIGPTIAAHLVERVSGQSFQEYQQEYLLDRLAMTSSAWSLSRTTRDRIVASQMRVPDAQGGWSSRRSPLFDLGTVPSGNLFSTVDDLSKFVGALIRNGGGLIKPETLQEMWRPQLIPADIGYGLGFLLGKFRGHQSVGHGGAIYGHSCSLVVLPEPRLAAIVLGNEDLANGRIQRISDAALSLMLEAKRKEALPRAPLALLPQDLSAFRGDYESQSCWCRLDVRDGRLVGELSGQPTRFTPVAELQFTADSRIENATLAKFERDESGNIAGFSLGTQRYRRVAEDAGLLPTVWRSLLGSYGPDFIPFVVSERYGHLYAMTENMLDYRLTPMNRNVCSLPAGLYSDEQAVFLSVPEGRIDSVNFANMVLAKKREAGTGRQVRPSRGPASYGRETVSLSAIRCHAQIERWPLAMPFRITGYTWEHVEVLVVTLEKDGYLGRGEAVGVYYLGDKPLRMLEQVEAMRSTLEAGINRAILRRLLPCGGARNALDCALWDLEAKLFGVPAWEMADLPRPHALLTTFTCGADTPERMAGAARAYDEAQAIKLKLTGEPVDADRVRAVREAVPDAWLGVDANQGFGRASLERLMPTLIAAKVALIEQPFPIGQDALLEGFQSPIPIAADESVQGESGVASLVGLFNVLNIKLDKCGGLTEGLKMAAAARECGLDVMVGNMMGTSLSMAPAFLLGQLCHVVDLDGPVFLKADRPDGAQYARGLISCPESLWGYAGQAT